MHNETSLIQRIKHRSATSDDVERLFSIEKANMMGIVVRFYPDRWSDNECREKIIENLDRTVIFELCEDYVGHFYWYPSDTYESVWLGSLQLKREYHGKGIGKRMMKIFEETVRAQGYRLVFLSVFNDTPAKELYRKLGYSEIKFDGRYAVEMKKELA